MTQVRFGAGGGEVAVEQVTGPLAVLGGDRGPDALGPSNPLQAKGSHRPVDRARARLPASMRRTSAVIFRRP